VTRRHPPAVWIVLVGLLFGATAHSNDEAPAVSLFLEPSLGSLESGEHRTVELRVNGVPASGLAAFQVTIAYDPSQLELLDGNAAYVQSGIKPFAPLGGSMFCGLIRGVSVCPDAPWMLTTTGRNAVGTASIEADQGKATIAYATHGSSSPATGDGVIATFEVVGKTDGAIVLQIADALLADASDPPRRYAWKGR
jgi:hypothetical protein